MAHTSSGHVCHIPEQEIAKVHLSCASKAWQIDALSLSWDHLDGYAFPPIPILPQVIQKMNTYPCTMILVAPGWPGMSWFWELIELATQPPLKLPLMENLLKQPHSNRFHTNLEHLNLHVWLLNSRTKSHQDFQPRWKLELRHLKGPPPEKYIPQGGPYFQNGVTRTRWTSKNLLSLK